jgi:hypothetical protein
MLAAQAIASSVRQFKQQLGQISCQLFADVLNAADE